jgi:hypothetical protein
MTDALWLSSDLQRRVDVHLHLASGLEGGGGILGGLVPL